MTWRLGFVLKHFSNKKGRGRIDEKFVNILKTVEPGINISVFILGVHTSYVYVWKVL